MSGSRSVANAKKRRGISSAQEKPVLRAPVAVTVEKAISNLNQNIIALGTKTGTFIQKLQQDIVVVSEHVDTLETRDEQVTEIIAVLTQQVKAQQVEIQALTTKLNSLLDTEVLASDELETATLDNNSSPTFQQQV